MPTTILETPRLALREMVVGDVEAFLPIFSDPETMTFYPKPFDRAMVEEWIEKFRLRYERDGYGLWTMILHVTGEIIGDCGVLNQELDWGIEIEIGYHVRRDLWGRGYATEAAAACRDYGFDVLGRERLVSLIRPQNVASKRVAEKIGLRPWKEIQWKQELTCVYAIERAVATRAN